LISDINNYSSQLKKLDVIPTSDFLLSTLLFWNEIENIKFYTIDNGVILVQLNPPFGIASVHLLTPVLNLKNINLAKETAELFDIKKIKFTFNNLEAFDSLSSLNLKEDYDEFEYIYNLNELANLEGSKFKKQRNSYSKALKEFNNFRTEFLNLNDVINKDELYLFCNECIAIKSEKNNLNKDNLLQELAAFKKCLDLSYRLHLKILKLYADEKLSGILIYEELNNEWIVGHFFKSINGLGVYLLKEFSSFLNEKNFKYFNFQEDRGVPSLRYFKEQLNPVFLLKTYFINL
jgi:hypothetical protein